MIEYLVLYTHNHNLILTNQISYLGKEIRLRKNIISYFARITNKYIYIYIYIYLHTHIYIYIYI